MKELTFALALIAFVGSALSFRYQHSVNVDLQEEIVILQDQVTVLNGEPIVMHAESAQECINQASQYDHVPAEMVLCVTTAKAVMNDGSYGLHLQMEASGSALNPMKASVSLACLLESGDPLTCKATPWAIIQTDVFMESVLHNGAPVYSVNHILSEECVPEDQKAALAAAVEAGELPQSLSEFGVRTC